MAVTLDKIVADFQDLQNRICAGLEAIDGKSRFVEDKWNREEGGGGRSRVIENGAFIEKGGVNFSHVFGPMPEKIATRLGIKPGTQFHATGVSIVLHAQHPLVPIIHMNVRYFETATGQYWFGGGIDVTPIYVDKAQARWFHQRMKSVCDNFKPGAYAEFKAWCDRYFYLKHRDETRGIGGLFFDHQKADDEFGKAKLFDFVLAVGNQFVPVYEYLVQENGSRPFTERHQAFQSFRRSRYVEFNLIWDAGTKFGLETGGRTESILMSMPPVATWQYNYRPEPGSPEAETLSLLKPRDWLS